MRAARPVFEANFHSFGEFERLLFSWLREKVDYAGNKITCVHSHPRVAALLKFPRRLLRLSPAASSLAVSLSLFVISFRQAAHLAVSFQYGAEAQNPPTRC
jgi:hypothetical protein